MAQDAAKQPQEEKERVKLNPDAQAALEKLVTREHQAKYRLKLIRRCIFLFLLLVSLPGILNFYVGQVIGTTFEMVIVRSFPHFTENTVRAAVITDKWYRNTFGLIMIGMRGYDENKFNEEVVALALEATSEEERNTEKILHLRKEVGNVLANASYVRKSALAFAVYELPPVKKAVIGPLPKNEL